LTPSRRVIATSDNVEEKAPKQGKPLARIGLAAGAGATGTWLLSKSVDLKAWDKLAREAFAALMVKDGPLPVILLLLLLLIAFGYHRIMMRLIESKDAEVQRVVQSRDRLEEFLGVAHPPSGARSRGKQ
jgi:hypothetical protein